MRPEFENDLPKYWLFSCFRIKMSIRNLFHKLFQPHLWERQKLPQHHWVGPCICEWVPSFSALICLETQKIKKKTNFKNFVNFTRKHLCWSLFLIKLLAWRPATLLKKDLHRRFPVNIAKFLRTSILKNIFDWLFCNFKVHVRVVFFAE